MKTAFTLLLVLVFTGLFGQAKSNTFKIKKTQPEICLAAIDSDYWDSAFSKEQLLLNGKLQLVGNFEDSIRITGFTIAMGTTSGQFIELTSPSDTFTTEIKTRLKEQVDRNWIIFKNIKCRTKSGQTFPVNGLAIKIYSQHKITHKNLHYPIVITTIPGLVEKIEDYSKDTASKTKLLQIGRIEVKGSGSDSSKILGFTLGIGYLGSTSYQSTDGYLTKDMIAYLKMLSKGAFVTFSNVKYQLPNGKVKFAADLPVYLTP